MERMRLELAAAGHDVQFVAINGISANSSEDRQSLIDRCAFPIFQDLPEVDVWALQGGGKDDLYVYDREGKLSAYLPAHGGVSTNLSTEEGYANLENAILSAE